MTRFLLLLFALALANAQGVAVEPGELPKSWRPAGPNCLEIPDWEVHAYNA